MVGVLVGTPTFLILSARARERSSDPRSLPSAVKPETDLAVSFVKEHPQRTVLEKNPLAQSIPREEGTGSSREEFLFNGTALDELKIDDMPIGDLDALVSLIAGLQMEQQSKFLDAWPVEQLRVISEEEYQESQLFLQEDLIFFPLRENGALSGQLAMVNPQDCPGVAFLRDVLRRVWRNDTYAKREEEKYNAFVADVSERCPLCAKVENSDRSVVFFYNPDGSVRASMRRSTVGNF